MKKTDFKWTPEAEAKIVELIKSGLSATEIALEFGVTKNAIAGKTHRFWKRQVIARVERPVKPELPPLGATRFSASDPYSMKAQAVEEALLVGYTVNYIGRMYRCSDRPIRARRDELGIKRPEPLPIDPATRSKSPIPPLPFVTPPNLSPPEKAVWLAKKRPFIEAALLAGFSSNTIITAYQVDGKSVAAIKLQIQTSSNAAVMEAAIAARAATRAHKLPAIQQALRAGMHPADIAKELHVAKSFVVSIQRDMGLCPPKAARVPGIAGYRLTPNKRIQPVKVKTDKPTKKTKPDDGNPTLPVRFAARPVPASAVDVEKSRGCQFIFTYRRPWICCNAPTLPGRSWCRECARVVYSKEQEAA